MWRVGYYVWAVCGGYVRAMILDGEGERPYPSESFYRRSISCSEMTSESTGSGRFLRCESIHTKKEKGKLFVGCKPTVMEAHTLTVATIRASELLASFHVQVRETKGGQKWNHIYQTAIVNVPLDSITLWRQALV